jgi:hypothetical protein
MTAVAAAAAHMISVDSAVTTELGTAAEGRVAALAAVEPTHREQATNAAVISLNFDRMPSSSNQVHYGYVVLKRSAMG